MRKSSGDAEAGGKQWKSVEDKEGVGRGSGGSGEVQEVRRRSGRPWESAEEAGKAREVTVRYRDIRQHASQFSRFSQLPGRISVYK